MFQKLAFMSGWWVGRRASRFAVFVFFGADNYIVDLITQQPVNDDLSRSTIK